MFSDFTMIAICKGFKLFLPKVKRNCMPCSSRCNKQEVKNWNGGKALINAWCFIQYHMKKSVRNTVTVRNLQSVKVVKTVVHRLSTGRGYLWGGKLFKIYSYKALVFRMTLPRSLHPFCTSTKLQ